MRRLDVTIQCMAVYNSSIEVPEGLTLEEAIEYARDHIKDIPLGVLEWVNGSDELDEENCCFADDNEFKDALISDDWSGFVQVSMIRNRFSEKEQWADTFYLALRKGEKAENEKEALQLLRERIQAFLTTKQGWTANVKASLDYNWGDFISELPLESSGLVWEPFCSGKMKLFPTVTVRVDQDELLAPEEAKGILYLYGPDGGLLATPWGVEINFQSGEITIPPECETPGLETALSKCVRGEMRLPYGREPDRTDTVLELDPEEGFMRLKCNDVPWDLYN